MSSAVSWWKPLWGVSGVSMVSIDDPLQFWSLAILAGLIAFILLGGLVTMIRGRPEPVMVNSPRPVTMAQAKPAPDFRAAMTAKAADEPKPFHAAAQAVPASPEPASLAEEKMPEADATDMVAPEMADAEVTDAEVSDAETAAPEPAPAQFLRRSNRARVF